MTEELTEHFNNIYTNGGGFYGVLEEIGDKLHFGRVTKKGNGVYQITTGGWSDDEEILLSLTSFLSRFGHNHYVGKLRGGVYYFDAFMHINDYEITRECPKCKFYCSKTSGGVVAPCKGLPCDKYEEVE